MKHLVRAATARLAASRRMIGLAGDTVPAAAKPDRTPNGASPRVSPEARFSKRATSGAAVAGVVEALLMMIESLIEP